MWKFIRSYFGALWRIQERRDYSYNLKEFCFGPKQNSEDLEKLQNQESETWKILFKNILFSEQGFQLSLKLPPFKANQKWKQIL